MYEPENNAVAQDSLRSVTTNYPKINCVIYDRTCSLLPSASRQKDLKQVKFDKFLAEGHSSKCAGSPYNCHTVILSSHAAPKTLTPASPRRSLLGSAAMLPP